MSVPGTNLENLPDEPEPIQAEDPTGQPPAVAEDDEDEGIVQSVKVGEQQMVPVGDLIRYRKEARTLRRQLAEAAPVIQRAQQVERKLQEVEPYVQAIRNNPGLIDAV